MTTEAWDRQQQLFHDLRELPDADRAARLDRLAQSEPELARTLQRWLDAASAEHLDDDFANAVSTLLARPQFVAGTRVGPYSITGDLGEGGMGAVYSAVHVETERPVVVKFLHHPFAPPHHQVSLVHEYRLVALLDDDPRIARLYDVGALTDGTHWFAMEWVRDALSLTQYCEDQRLPLRERLRLFTEVCDAVAHAHSRGIVHRDLKPSNVLVSGSGEVKLVDFGIAAVIADLDPDPGAVHPGSPLMSPASASPEQLRQQHAGALSDLYQLGRLLYELLAGRPPLALDGCSVEEAARRVQDERPQPPSTVRTARAAAASDIDWYDLDGICLRLLEVEPARRYASAERLVADLHDTARGVPISVHRGSAAYRARKFVSRHRRAIAVATLAVAALTWLAASSAIRIERERRRTATEIVRTQRLQQFLLGLFTGNEPDVGPARALTVRQLLARGELTANLLSGQPDIQDDLTRTLGTIYGQLGDFSAAERLLTSGLDGLRRRLPDSAPAVIDSQVALATLYADEQKLEPAEALARQATTATLTSLVPGDPVAIRAGLALGKVLIAKGAYAEALTHLEAVDRRLEGAERDGEAASGILSQLAEAHQYLGHLDEADRLHQRALALDRQLHGDRHPDVADDLLSLADIANTRGDYPAAERSAREALEIFKDWYGNDHPETGSAMRIVAQYLSAQEQLDEAATLLDQARAIFVSAYPGPHRRIGLVLNDLGMIALRRKRPEEAIAAFTQALAAYRATYPSGKTQYISVGLANLGSVYLETGDFAHAEALLREAAALSADVIGPEHPSTAIAEIKLGRSLVKQQRFGEAIPWLERGQANLAKQAGPSVTWLQRAKEDLAIARSAAADR